MSNEKHGDCGYEGCDGSNPHLDVDTRPRRAAGNPPHPKITQTVLGPGVVQYDFGKSAAPQPAAAIQSNDDIVDTVADAIREARGDRRPFTGSTSHMLARAAIAALGHVVPLSRLTDADVVDEAAQTIHAGICKIPNLFCSKHHPSSMTTVAGLALAAVARHLGDKP